MKKERRRERKEKRCKQKEIKRERRRERKEKRCKQQERK